MFILNEAMNGTTLEALIELVRTIKGLVRTIKELVRMVNELIRMI